MRKERDGCGSELDRKWDDVRVKKSIGNVRVRALVLPFSSGCLEGTCLLQGLFPVIEKQFGEGLVGEKTEFLS